MKKTASKKNHLILAVLSTLAVVLFAAVCLQGRQINRFIDGPDEKSRAEIKADSSSSEKIRSQDDGKAYQTKIKKLEARITEMQGLQDHLEETLNRYDIKDDSSVSDLPEKDAVSKAKENFYLRRNFLKQHRDFLNQNNYPPELKQKLWYLFNKRDNALVSTVRELMSFVPGNINGNLAELVQQGEQIKAKYYEELAKLLPEEDIALFKEYEQTGFERSILNGLNDWLDDDNIEEEKGKELIALWYNYRQVSRKEQREKAQSYRINRDGPDEETMARIRKDNLEYNIKLYESYASLSEGFLSESQMEIFEWLLNSNKSSFNYNAESKSGSDQANSLKSIDLP